MPAPEENHAAFYEHLLRRNRKLYGAAFAIGEEDAVFLVGPARQRRRHDDELDRIARLALRLGGAVLPPGPSHRLRLAVRRLNPGLRSIVISMSSVLRPARSGAPIRWPASGKEVTAAPPGRGPPQSGNVARMTATPVGRWWADGRGASAGSSGGWATASTSCRSSRPSPTDATQLRADFPGVDVRDAVTAADGTVIAVKPNDVPAACRRSPRRESRVCSPSRPACTIATLEESSRRAPRSCERCPTPRRWSGSVPRPSREARGRGRRPRVGRVVLAAVGIVVSVKSRCSMPSRAVGFGAGLRVPVRRSVHRGRRVGRAPTGDERGAQRADAHGSGSAAGFE